MKIFDKIKSVFVRSHSVLRDKFSVWGRWKISDLPFADLIFYNILEIKTDLANDVSWSLRKGDRALFADFVAFYRQNGQRLFGLLATDGYAVVGYDKIGFTLIPRCDCREWTENGLTKIAPKDKERWQGYDVIRDEDYKLYGKSSYELCSGWRRFLDNVLNSSNTITEHFGALCIAMPTDLPGSLVPVTMDADERKGMEAEWSEDYGSLSRQSQVLVLSRKMDFQTINMAGLDIKLDSKVRLAILAICDRLKVPANQVAIIDANSNKALSNGSELIAGDFAKYQSFERMLNHTFITLADDLGLLVDYTIYNKPQRQVVNA